MSAAILEEKPARSGPVRLLLVEDSADDADLLLRHLTQGGFQVEHRRVETGDAMRSALEGGPWDLIISDYSMPNFDGVSAYALLRETGNDIPFIFVSGNLGEDVAVEAMRLGVSDYFVKGKLKRLVPAIQRELRKMEERRRHREAEASLRNAEQQLRQSQKMEAVGRLAGGVAHDFNNLLTVIFGYTDLLLSSTADPAETQFSLQEIRRCAERAAALTHQLLAFSRRQVLQRRPLALNLVVGDITSMLQRLIGEDIELDWRPQEGLGAVEADPGQVDQVLMNLAINARDAMPGGGKLSIRTANVRLSSGDVADEPGREPGDYVLLEVADNGAGIDEVTLAHIFEPFFTTKDAGKGTGLGLATVYGIVHQSGGHLRVDSALGRGTRFSIYLPRCAQPVSLDPSSTEPGARSFNGVETILVVEDEESLREFIELVLSRRGYRVLAAPDAAQALSLSQGYSSKIDLLLTDITLPGLDGRELASRLMLQRPDLQALLMTGYAHPQVLEEMEKGGINCVLKPFGSDELLKAIRRALAAKRLPKG
jgi:two-component system cell cycle sensor histidine kinase/response regulator CckA